MLVLLNGPSASGKSTIAERLAQLRPLTLNCDIDIIRSQLGGWLEAPTDAGLAARALAISMIETHLRAGHAGVVPQLLARPEFIAELEGAAASTGAAFIELALDVTAGDARRSFAERSRAPTSTAHRDAARLVEQAGSADPIGDFVAQLNGLLAARPTCHRIDAPRGDIEATLANVLAAIAEHGVDWTST